MGAGWQFEEAPGLRQVVGLVFPTLHLSRVRLRRGIPRIARRLRPRPGAITLPHPFVPGRVEIHFQPHRFQPASLRGLDLVLHESFHALQVQECGGRLGLGLAHPFILLYVSLMVAVGMIYPRHPMERDAYAQFGDRRSRLRALAERFEAEHGEELLPWDRLEPGAEPFDDAELAEIARRLAPLVVETSDLRPVSRFVATAPLWGLLAPVWAVLWLAFGVVAWVVAAPVEIVERFSPWCRDPDC